MLKKFLELQRRVKAPKSETNNYSKFTYRNLEKMLADAKPIFEEFKYSVIFRDNIVAFGERIFLESDIVVTDEDKDSDEFGQYVSAKGWAEIPRTMGSMQPPQITGSASSYARKYAFCNLFAIDGSTDVDSLPQETCEERLARACKSINDAVNSHREDLYRSLVKEFWDEFKGVETFVKSCKEGKTKLGIA